MYKYILKRILIAIPVLIGITIIDYAIMCMAGSPLAMMQGPRVSEAALEAKKLPRGTDFTQIKGLKTEAAIKLNKIMPENLLRASEISGVSPADIQVLSVWLAIKSRNEKKGD